MNIDTLRILSTILAIKGTIAYDLNSTVYLYMEYGKAGDILIVHIKSHSHHFAHRSWPCSEGCSIP